MSDAERARSSRVSFHSHIQEFQQRNVLENIDLSGMGYETKNALFLTI